MRLLFLLLLGAGLAQAETFMIRGTVRGPDGVPLTGAEVRLTATDQLLTRSTIATGSYQLPAVPAGRYLLSATATGFSTEARELTVDGALTVDLTLQLRAASTAITVTAENRPLPTEEATKPLSVVSNSELQQRGARTVLDAVRLLPGARVVQLGGPGHLSAVRVRGLRTADTALVVDGFRLRDPSGTQGDASAFWSDLLLADTARVEVLRGSGSALYGSNAMGGLVNVVTEGGGGPWRGSLQTEGGGLGLFRGTAQVSGSAFADRLRMSFGAAHLNVTRGIDGQDRTRNTVGQSWVQGSVTPTLTLSGRLFLSRSYLDLNTSPSPLGTLPPRPVVAGPGNFTPALNDPDSSRQAEFTSGLLFLTKRWTPALTMRLAYQRLLTRRNNPDGPLGPGFQPRVRQANQFDGQIDTTEARTDWQATPWLNAVFGYEWERDAFDNSGRTGDPGLLLNRVQASQRAHAGFAQAQARGLHDRLTVSVAGRVQTFLTGAPAFTGGAPQYAGVAFTAPPRALTGDVAAAYRIWTGGRVRAHAGNSYRAPSLYERLGTGFFAGRFTPYGDPVLAPERAMTLDAGVDQRLWANRLTVSASVFYTRLQEVVDFGFGIFGPSGDRFGRTAGYFNTGGGLARGVEVEAETRPLRSLTLRSSYTYTNADERRGTVAGTLQAPRAFAHQGTAVALWSRGRWDAATEVLVASRYLGRIFSQGYWFAGPRQVGVTAGYTLPVRDRSSLRLYVRCDNALNQNYYEEGYRTPRRWAVAGLRWAF